MKSFLNISYLEVNGLVNSIVDNRALSNDSLLYMYFNVPPGVVDVCNANGHNFTQKFKVFNANC